MESEGPGGGSGDRPQKRRIGIIGGTGGMGRGFALRWCRNNDVVIGSRDAGRAAAAAAEYASAAAAAYGSIGGSITGASNEDAARGSDVLVLSIPYENIGSTCPAALAAAPDGCVVVSPIVPMEKTAVGFEFLPVRDGKPSSHELVSGHARESTPVVSAFHVISEKKLADPARALDYDVFVCGDSKDAVGTVSDLVRQIEGLRPLLLGPGALAYMAEIATPILLNAMIRNGIKNPGIKVA